METGSDRKNLIDKKASWGRRAKFWKERMAADAPGSTKHHLVDTLKDKHATGFSVKKAGFYRIKNLLFKEYSLYKTEIWKPESIG